MASVGAFGQRQWTLDDCLKYALDNNLQYKRAELEVKLGSTNVTQSIMNMVPTISADGTYSRVRGLDYNYNTSKYEDAQVEGGNLSLAGSVTLFQGFALINSARASRYDFEKAKASLATERKNLSLNIMVKYIDVLFKRDLYKATLQQESISKQNLEKEENLYNLGGVSNAEYLEIKAQYARSAADVVSYQNQYQLVLVDLAQLLEVPDVMSFNIASPTSMDTTLINDLPQLNGVLAEKDSWFPELKVARNNMKARELNYYSALGELAPRLFFSYSLSSWFADNATDPRDPTGMTSYPAYSYQSQINDNRLRSISVGLSIPILDRFSAQTNRARKKIAYNDAKYSYQQTVNAATKEVINAYLEATGAWNNYVASKEKLDASTAAWNAAKEKYDLGAASSIDLGIAQKNLFEATTNFINSKYSYVLRKKILDYYQGKPLAFE